MAYLYVDVGGSKDYTTINEGLAAASNGDTIVIDPGVYEERLYLDRHVNLKGNTTTPENGDVEIRPPLFQSPVIQLNYDASVGSTQSPDFYFEGLYLHLVENASSQNVFHSIAQGSGAERTSLYFNRCIFTSDASGYSGFGLSLSDTYFQKVSLRHCFINKIGSGTFYQFNNAYWTRHTDGSEILSCEYDRAASYNSGAGSPFPHNYVTTTTSGYGPLYGTDYIKIPYGYFEGYVKEQNAGVQRELYLHNREDGELMASTTSDITGYYYMETPVSGSHYIVCKDDPAQPVYNDLVIGNAYPTEL